MLGHPGSGPPATPNVVDQSGWWRVPGTLGALMAYLRAHRPAGSALVVSGGVFGEGISYTYLGFGWPARTGVLGTRWLVVEAVQLPDGSTGLRADAQVVWLTPRPASERIPSNAALVRVRVNRLGSNGPLQRPAVVSSPRRVHRLVRLLNSLPAEQPGISSCPLDDGIRVRLALYSVGERAPSAVVLVNPGGCEEVGLTIRGRVQPALTGLAFPGSGRPLKPALIRQVEQTLGVALPSARPGDHTLSRTRFG